ncbi:hypothetical protein Xszus_00819 [Xenorhabdus szentirmaii]|nr:hypothetical protein Xsze_03297 [Xenorhabdus szentirmaii DSM 16338]PHM41142.1 hypothetical protein Xszus_00819 [Xenorhabdus szentirmaii]
MLINESINQANICLFNLVNMTWLNINTDLASRYLIQPTKKINGDYVTVKIRIYSFNVEM